MSAPVPDPLALTLPPTTDSVTAMLDAIEAWADAAGLPHGIAHRLGVVMEELVANIAMHGASGADGATFVAVTMRQESGTVIATVEDDGRAFDPLAQAAPDVQATLDERDVGGLGVHFARTMARELRYAREAGRNRVIATFDLG